MRATFKLLNSYFWKTIYGPIISFLFPVLLLAILGNIMRIQYVFPGIMAMSYLFIGVLALPLALMELKGSSLFKYIGSSPVNPKKFTIVAIGFYVFVALVSTLIIFLATMIIFKNDVFPRDGYKSGLFSGLNKIFGAFNFLVAMILHLSLVLVSGLIIATFSKTPQQALTVAIVVIIPSMFLSGMILSVDIIAQSAVMQWISRLIPYRYTTGNIVISTTPLDQIGDFYQLLSVKEKKIIFKSEVIDDLGVLHFRSGVNNKEYTVHNIKELLYMYDDLRFSNPPSNEFQNSIVADSTLFNLLFQGKDASLLSGSSNNIFDLTHTWGVHRIPDVNSIQMFVKGYFMGDDGTGGSGGAGRFASIWGDIQQGDYTFLDMFFKQISLLYNYYDRSANLFIPAVISIGGVFVVYKNFKWSSR